MSEIKGNLSIHSENIFPIIKKWLYSDHDIFIRELVSNASDAITKMKRLASLGEADLKGDDDFKITVTYDDAAKTIAISDNGIGMTAEEIEKYINQIAFSGAEAFVEKFKDKEDKDQIIGHFGLGFYSAFMVASQVTIDTLSYQDGATAAFWTCDGGTEFTIKDSARTTRGTTVTLYLSDEGEEFKSQYKIKNTLGKYCGFMPYPIFFDVTGLPEPEEPAKSEQDDDTADVPEVVEPINNTTPLYLKSPGQIEDKEYRDFYRDTFMDFKEPLFWIHLNMDYPFRLKGILYFPKINSEFEGIEGQIKLYNTQVYVADNIKEVIPEFLLLLKGVIDCPDLPLNVSRSFLQNDGFVKKVQDYITKKVADKLNGLNKTDRANYEKFWDDINPFVKYGAMKDDKFYDKVKDSILYKTTANVFSTLADYRATLGDKTKGDVYYTSDAVQQAQYIAMLKEHDIDVLVLDERIDQAFISFIESKMEGVAFKRVDADVAELLTEETAESDDQEGKQKIIDALVALYKRVLAKEDVKVELKALKSQDIAAMITLSESNRRMQDMMKMYAMGGLGGDLPSDETLVLNKNHKLVKYTLEHMYEENELSDLVAKQLYDLAVLSHKPLSGEQMNAFIKRSNLIMEKLL